jgi:hypothetical protein
MRILLRSWVDSFKEAPKPVIRLSPTFKAFPKVALGTYRDFVSGIFEGPVSRPAYFEGL